MRSKNPNFLNENLREKKRGKWGKGEWEESANCYFFLLCLVAEEQGGPVF